jgi:predicted XRE-type DNA-binding protein
LICALSLVGNVLAFSGDAADNSLTKVKRTCQVLSCMTTCAAMKERLEVIRGSGNVFRDLNVPNADVEQLKSILAVEIIKTLDAQGLSVRAAHRLTGFAAADYSRVRNADLARFTVDRLMTMINKLGSRVVVAVKVRRPSVRAQQALTHAAS